MHRSTYRQDAVCLLPTSRQRARGHTSSTSPKLPSPFSHPAVLAVAHQAPGVRALSGTRAPDTHYKLWMNVVSGQAANRRTRTSLSRVLAARPPVLTASLMHPILLHKQNGQREGARVLRRNTYLPSSSRVPVHQHLQGRPGRRCCALDLTTVSVAAACCVHLYGEVIPPVW